MSLAAVMLQLPLDDHFCRVVKRLKKVVVREGWRGQTVPGRVKVSERGKGNMCE